MMGSASKSGQPLSLGNAALTGVLQGVWVLMGGGYVGGWIYECVCVCATWPISRQLNYKWKESVTCVKSSVYLQVAAGCLVWLPQAV